MLKDSGEDIIHQQVWSQWAKDGSSVWIVVNLVHSHIKQAFVKGPLQELVNLLFRLVIPIRDIVELGDGKQVLFPMIIISAPV